LDVPIFQNLEEGLDQRIELVLINGLVAVEVQQVENVIDLVLCGLICAYQLAEDPDDLGELVSGQSSVVIFVELSENFVQKRSNHLLM